MMIQCKTIDFPLKNTFDLCAEQFVYATHQNEQTEVHGNTCKHDSLTSQAKTQFHFHQGTSLNYLLLYTGGETFQHAACMAQQMN